MKRKFWAYTAAVLVGFAAIMIALFVYSMPLSYEEQVRQDFADPAKIALINSLYEKVEAVSPSELGLVDLHSSSRSDFGFPRTRIIPPALVPHKLKAWAFRPVPFENEAYPLLFGNVLAHYDANDHLLAIEFYGSRYGGFVSKNSSLEPKGMPGMLMRLTDEPLHITARVSGEHPPETSAWK